MDYLQDSSSSFVTDHDAQILLQTYHQEYANGSIERLDPSFAHLFKQKLSPHFSIRLIRLTIAEIMINHVSGLNARALYDQDFAFVQAIVNGHGDIPTFYDGMRCQAVIDSVLLSAQERRWVDVADVPTVTAPIAAARSGAAEKQA